MFRAWNSKLGKGLRVQEKLDLPGGLRRRRRSLGLCRRSHGRLVMPITMPYGWDRSKPVRSQQGVNMEETIVCEFERRRWRRRQNVIGPICHNAEMAVSYWAVRCRTQRRAINEKTVNHHATRCVSMGRLAKLIFYSMNYIALFSNHVFSILNYQWFSQLLLE